ncbi:unnamed protein product [Aphanomyces euteiches]
MLSVDEFIQCCQVFLVNGSAGSAAQKEAHERLLVFQQLPTSWQVTLQVLMASCDKSAQSTPVPDSAKFISAQIVRFSIPMLADNDQILVRDSLLEYLRVAKNRGVSTTPAERLVCLAIASEVVYIASDWGSWKNRLQGALLDDPSSIRGLQLLLDILGGIPGELYSACSTAALNGLSSEPFEAMVREFHKEKNHVLQLVSETLSSASDVAPAALTVLQNWGHDTMPHVGMEFGLSCLDLSDGGLFGPLMDFVVSAKPEVSQLATEIICDAFAHMSNAPSIPYEKYHQEAVLVIRLAKQILTTEPVLAQTQAGLSSQSEIDEDDQRVVAARGLSKIAACIACGGSHYIFAGNWCLDVRRGEGCDDNFSLTYLNFLVRCTSFPVVSVVEPTLEFWYTLLEMPRQWTDVPGLSPGADWTAFVQLAMPVVEQVVSLLLQRCQFPQHFIQTNQLKSDHADVDDVRDLRREIGDVLLSLFTAWPSTSQTNALQGSFSCLEHIIQMVRASEQIHELDALLFVLDYMVELFDLDDIEQSDPVYIGVKQLWQVVIQEFARFPDHVLLLHGMSRYAPFELFNWISIAWVRLISSLVLPIQFDGPYYVSMTTAMVKGLKKRRVGLQVRGDCIQVLLATMNDDNVHATLSAFQAAYGDVLEALLRLGHNFPDAGMTLLVISDDSVDYVTLVNCAFPRLVTSLQGFTPNSNPNDVAAVFYLLARGLCGIQNLPIRNAFLVQEWTLIHPIALHHGSSNAKVRETAVELFIVMIPSCTHVDTLVAIVSLCLTWHDQSAAPNVLACLRVLASTQKMLHPQLLGYLTTAFRSCCAKFDYVPGSPDVRTRLLERFLHPHEDLAQEGIQIFLLMREVIRAAPEVLRGSSLLVEVLQFGCDVLAVDHKLPDVTDAVCSFFGDVLSQDIALPVLQQMAAAWIEALLIFVAISTVSSKTRCVSQVFHQALHAGDTDSHLRDVFSSALQHVLVQRQLFQQRMTSSDAFLLAQSMLGIKDRRKFQVFLGSMAMYIQGYGPPPWTAPQTKILSPRSPLHAVDILH